MISSVVTIHRKPKNGRDGIDGKGILHQKAYYWLGGADEVPTVPSVGASITESLVSTTLSAPLGADYGWKEEPMSMTAEKPNRWTYMITIYTDYSVVQTQPIVTGTRFVKISADDIDTGTLSASVGINAVTGTVGGWTIGEDSISSKSEDYTERQGQLIGHMYSIGINNGKTTVNDDGSRNNLRTPSIKLSDFYQRATFARTTSCLIDPSFGIGISLESSNEISTNSADANFSTLLKTDCSGRLAKGNISWDTTGAVKINGVDYTPYVAYPFINLKTSSSSGTTAENINSGAGTILEVFFGNGSTFEVRKQSSNDTLAILSSVVLHVTYRFICSSYTNYKIIIPESTNMYYRFVPNNF